MEIEEPKMFIHPENGNKTWCLGRELHRLDGPAVVYSFGDVSYYIHNKRYIYKNWYIHPEVKSFRIEQERIKKLEMI